MTDILNFNTLVTLKKICKMLRIKNYSFLRKNELILIINRHHAYIKIQKWVRKILSKGESCSISCEPIKYPCFAFKTPNNILIYYNLSAIRNFLIKTGDFRDPNTRDNYTDSQLLEMDNIYKYHRTLHPITDISEDNENYFKSVFQASKNKRFYERIKNRELEQLIYERVLDAICEDMVLIINESYINTDTFNTIETMYLYDYKFQFRRLLLRSKTHAKYVIDKNIENFNQLNTCNYGDNFMQHNICDYVIVSLFQIREELFF